jgi:hypothetical protein
VSASEISEQPPVGAARAKSLFLAASDLADPAMRRAERAKYAETKPAEKK